jgi:parallel beta-helix repeat protein
MTNKAIVVIMLPLFSIGVLISCFCIKSVNADVTIYIRSDGSVYPPTAPIQKVGYDSYLFTANVTDPIVVERSNIIIDGARNAVNGRGSGIGINMGGQVNVTICNTIVQDFAWGIQLADSHSNNILGNTIVHCFESIQLKPLYAGGRAADFNNIVGNNLRNSTTGILVHESSYNNISSNVLTEVNTGINIWAGSGFNVIESNTIQCSWRGISLGSVSKHNTIAGNEIEGGANSYGISIRESSSHNAIYRNTITNEGYEGITIAASDNISVKKNNLTNNSYGISLAKCSNVTIAQNSIKSNNQSGVRLIGHALDNIVSENNIAGNEIGVSLFTDGVPQYLRNNKIVANNITDNNVGVSLSGCSDNQIYHNNFLGNAIHVSTEDDYDFWDDGYPSGGNHWDDYTGIDSNGDGIGDTPYLIKGYNVDRYPLMTQYVVPQALIVSLTPSSTVTNSGKVVDVIVRVTNGTLVTKDALVQMESDKGGAFAPESGYTNSDGDFTATFTSPSVSQQTNVRITATASKSGYSEGSDYKYITVYPPGTLFLSVTINADPATVEAGETSTVEVRVTDGTNAVSDATVTLSSNKGGSLSPSSGQTNANGDFSAAYAAPSVTAQTTITITVNAAKTGYLSGQGQTLITVEIRQPHASPDLTLLTYLVILAVIVLIIGGGVTIARRRSHRPKQESAPPS